MRRQEARAPLQITLRGVVVSGSARDIVRARRTFAREHSLRLPGFLAPDLLPVVQDSVARARFRRRRHAGFGTDLELRDGWRASALAVLLNDTRLFRAIRRLTGCADLGAFNGSIRRAVAGPGRALSWHDDNSQGRLLALTVNLGRRPYAGGRLQIRRKGARALLQDLTNTVPGDAVLLRVRADLEHRNTEITGAAAKTAFSGWFIRRSDRRGVSTLPPELRSPRAVNGPAAGAVPVTRDGPLSLAYGIASRRAGARTLYVDMLTGTVHELNATGARVCGLVAGGATLRAISRAIADEYAVPPAEAEEDVKSLLSELARQGVVRVGT